jgi:hypothetical protein
LKVVCSATKANGEACTLPAQGQHGLCWAHDPADREKRRQVASRGGRGKAAKRTAVLWDEVRDVIAGVESERLSPPQANTMLKGYSTLIALERLAVEQSELEIGQRRLQLDVEERTTLKKRLAVLEEYVVRKQGSWAT